MGFTMHSKARMRPGEEKVSLTGHQPALGRLGPYLHAAQEQHTMVNSTHIASSHITSETVHRRSMVSVCRICSSLVSLVPVHMVWRALSDRSYQNQVNFRDRVREIILQISLLHG